MTLVYIRMATLEMGDDGWYWLIPAAFVLLSVASVILAIADRRAAETAGT